jgi:DNA-binding GntR family transcriptional regulator
MTGKLLPNERLVEAELASSLRVPRATVRTAIIRLAQEQLVERLPNKGARVRRISEMEALENLEARVELESLAARHAAARATNDDIRGLRKMIESMEAELNRDPLSYTDNNQALHQEIIRIADHQTARRLLDDLRSRNTAYQVRPVLAPGEPRERLRQHRAIIDAIAKHDGEKAAEAMRAHVADVARRLRARLEQSD